MSKLPSGAAKDQAKSKTVTKKNLTTNARAREIKPFVKCSDELVDKICNRIASGEAVAKICSGDDMPSRQAFFNWIESNPTIKTKYEIAVDLRAELLAEDIISIADEYPPADGESGKIDSAWVQWQKTRVDARKWTASRLKPKKYGDRTVLEGNKDAPLQVEQKTTVDLGTDFNKITNHLLTKFNIKLDLSD